MSRLKFLFSKTLLYYLWHEFRLRCYFKFVVPRMNEIVLDGLRLDVSTLSVKARHRLLCVGYETHEKLMCRDFLDPSDSVLELGAAIGFIGLYCQKQIGIRQYISVEANPRTLEMLKRNYQLNGLRPVAWHAALAPVNGHIALNVDSDFWENSVVDSGDHGNGRKTMDVPGLTFETLMAQVAQPFNVLIVDVEGAELFIDLDRLPDSVQKIIAELHPHLIGPDKTYQIVSTLVCKGFRVARAENNTFVFLKPVVHETQAAPEHAPAVAESPRTARRNRAAAPAGASPAAGLLR